MAARRRITRLVDARRSQQRVTIWLECHHILSLTVRDLEAMSQGEQHNFFRDNQPDQYRLCPVCPDPTPIEVRREKSATQLWKEAGEPIP